MWPKVIRRWSTRVISNMCFPSRSRAVAARALQPPCQSSPQLMLTRLTRREADERRREQRELRADSTGSTMSAGSLPDVQLAIELHPLGVHDLDREHGLPAVVS